MPDFEAMTLDELIEYKLERKRQIQAIREEQLAAHAVYTRKLQLASLAQKLGVPVDGITPEQAAALLAIANQTPPKPGDVVVTPGHAVLTAEGQTSEVSSD